MNNYRKWFENLQAAHETLIDVPLKDECFISVVVPVRNEAAYLAKTLDAFARQVTLKNCPLDPGLFEIIFFVNNSRDDSAELIKHWRDEHQLLNIHLAEENLPAEKANIGYVRRRLMNEAFLRLRGNGFGGGVIATTDGDTAVAPNWIAANLAEILGGAEAVGGRILIDPDDLQAMDAKCRDFHLRDAGYRLMAAEVEFYLDELAHDPVPRHHQHFNGSFAVTTAAFEKSGGVPEVEFLEDVAFYHALLRRDARFRHSPRARVETSARCEGRTALGLSTQMNEWTIMGGNNDEYFVESAGTIAKRLEARKKMRFAWHRQREKNYFSFDEIRSLADDLKIPFAFLKDEIILPQPFGNLYEKVLSEQNRFGEWQRENPLAGIEKAIFDLRLLLEKLRKTVRR